MDRRSVLGGVARRSLWPDAGDGVCGHASDNATRPRPCVCLSCPWNKIERAEKSGPPPEQILLHDALQAKWREGCPSGEV